MDHTSTCGHPLHITGAKLSRMSLRVFVFHLSRKNVRYSFESTVRVIRRTLRLIRRDFHWTHFIQKEKRIEVRKGCFWKWAAHEKASAFQSFDTIHNPRDTTSCLS